MNVRCLWLTRASLAACQQRCMRLLYIPPSHYQPTVYQGGSLLHASTHYQIKKPKLENEQHHRWRLHSAAPPVAHPAMQAAATLHCAAYVTVKLHGHALLYLPAALLPRYTAVAADAHSVAQQRSCGRALLSAPAHLSLLVCMYSVSGLRAAPSLFCPGISKSHQQVAVAVVAAAALSQSPCVAQ